MDTKAKIEVMQAFLDGKVIEMDYCRSEEWEDWPSASPAPIWNWEKHNYRVKQEKPDSVDWSHVAEGYDWMARDEDEFVCIWTEEPDQASEWWESKGFFVNAKGFASYKRGTCDWRNSLVKRPE